MESKTIWLEKAQIPAAWLGGYKGSKLRATITDTVELQGMNYSGGSKNTYRILLVGDNGFSVKGIPAGDWREPERSTVRTGPGALDGFNGTVIVVQHIEFCSKDLGLVFHVHPDNAQRFLPTQEEYDHDMRIVCECTAKYKSSYGGVKNLRFVEAHREFGITQEDWDAAKVRCIEAGLLRKNGAITPKGRNNRLTEI